MANVPLYIYLFSVNSVCTIYVWPLSTIHLHKKNTLAYKFTSKILFTKQIDAQIKDGVKQKVIYSISSLRIKLAIKFKNPGY